jgi:hypothetical protein
VAEGDRPGAADDTVEARAYRRGFRQKNRRDDYALDLFQEARAKLGTDSARVDQLLRELARLYNPLIDGPVVGLAERARILTLLEQGRAGEAEVVLDTCYRRYAPHDDDTERTGPSGPGV